jgi:hypothetical protein
MIEFEDRSGVTILHMVRGKGNALNLELTGAMLNALDGSRAGRPAQASSPAETLLQVAAFADKAIKRRD